MTVSIAQQYAPANAVASKLLAALGQVGARHVIASDEVAAPLRAGTAQADLERCTVAAAAVAGAEQ